MFNRTLRTQGYESQLRIRPYGIGSFYAKQSADPFFNHAKRIGRQIMVTENSQILLLKWKPTF